MNLIFDTNTIIQPNHGWYSHHELTHSLTFYTCHISFLDTRMDLIFMCVLTDFQSPSPPPQLYYHTDTPVPFDQIKNCALNISLDSSVFSQTLSSIRKTIPMYVFLEYVKDALDPHFNIQVDLLAELEKISQQHYERDFDFHQDLVTLFRKLNDGHTLYFGPQCYGNLIYRQPFTIISYVENGIQKIGIASLNNASGIVNYYQQLGFDLNSYVGSEIKEIDGELALNYMINWANQYSGGYKDPGARFNVAISNLFMTRSLNRSPIPSKPTVTYVLSRDGAADVTLELPWVGSSLMSYNSSVDFYQSCLSSPSSQHTTRTTLTQQPLIEAKRQKLLHPLQELRTSPLLSHTVQTEHKVVNRLTGDQVSYFEIDGQVGVITIDSFVPQSEVAFAKDFQMSMYMAKLNKIPKLIIDVTNNGGGEECLGYALIKYLYSSTFSQNFATLFARTDMIATELGRALALKGASQLGPNDDSIWNPTTWRDMNGVTYSDASWYTVQHNYTRGGNNAPSHAYTSILKENYCQSSFDNYYFTGEDLLNYSPDNIILLSNGRCASTCALFTRHLQESKKAKTVVVGGVHRQSQQIAQVPGGQVYEFEDLLADIQTLKINSDLAPSPLPVKSRLRFAIREAYAWSEPDLKPLEFFFEGSDFRLDYSKESAVDRSKVWIDTLQFFDICATWQTKSCEIPNGSGQQSCVGGKYATQCQLVACAPGFGVATTDSSCQPCPIGHYKGTDGTTCLACTNKPSSDNSRYTNSSTSNNCPFECVEGFVLDSVNNVCVESQNLTIGKVLFGFIVTLCILFLLFACLLLGSTIFLFVKNYRNRMANNEALRLI